jgi:hypothetical protein
LSGITDGGGAGNKLRFVPIQPANSLCPQQYLRNMTAEDPLIGMDFVQNNQREPFEKISPGVMKSQQAQVKHIRICYQHPGRIISDFLSFRIRRVPVINAGVQPNPGGKIQKRIKLITFQGLKWEQHKHV